MAVHFCLCSGCALQCQSRLLYELCLLSVNFGTENVFTCSLVIYIMDIPIQMNEQINVLHVPLATCTYTKQHITCTCTCS